MLVSGFVFVLVLAFNGVNIIIYLLFTVPVRIKKKDDGMVHYK